MPRWRLEYYLGTPHYPRSVEAEFDDLLGDGIRAAHDYVRDVSQGEGTLRYAVLLVDQEELEGEDPLAGGPAIPLWITYVPYRPGDDPDKEDSEPRRREVFHFPSRLFETRVTAEGEAIYDSPAMGYLSLAIRRRLDDGREGTILKVETEEG